MKLRYDQDFRHPAEQQAWLYFAKLGHRLLCHNYHARIAEIDLLTLSPDGTVHAIEVKSWKEKSLTHPLESLSEERQKQIRSAFRLFLSDADKDPRLHPLSLASRPVSFDLIWIQKSSVDYFPALF